MKNTFRLLWLLSVLAVILFAIMGYRDAVYFSIGVMWVCFFGILFSKESKNKL